jgi:hypothetical protein
MNDKIKNFIHSHYISIPIFIVFCIIACIWFYADRASNIDTTGIRNAQNELRHVREYNQQSIEYNQRVRDAVENSQTLNERTEERINTSIELNTRTENAIDRGTELTAKARTDAERAKAIIGQSRDILRTAEERNQKSENPTTKQ